MRYSVGDRVRLGDYVGTITYVGFILYLVHWDSSGQPDSVVSYNSDADDALQRFAHDPQEEARMLDQQRRHEHAMRYL